MKLKALIVESSAYYRDVLALIMSGIGVDCDIFSSGEAAIEVSHDVEYAFIFVNQNLDDMGGELFLYRYRKKYALAGALPIMITSDVVTEVMVEANKVGFKVVFNTKDFDSISIFLTSVLNNRTLNLKGNILLIQDGQDAAASTAALLENYHAKIDHVTHLSEAKEKFADNNYDLVITDFYLKDKETGDAVINFVRKHDDSNKARIPILVVSPDVEQARRTALLRNGANDFIIKPYDQDELVARASNLIETKKVYEKVKNQEEQLAKIAMTDQLTGLYNRYSLFDIGPKYLSDAKRHQFSLSLFVIDLDHFKNVNDSYGHGVGDKVLNEIGKVLNENCREEDFVARFGGEEFVMILTHCDLDAALKKAEYLRKAIEDDKPNDLVITASIGVAAFNKNDDLESLFEKADRAAYEAKESGRNTVIAHPDKYFNVV